MAAMRLFWQSRIREAQTRFLYCTWVQKYYTKYIRPCQKKAHVRHYTTTPTLGEYGPLNPRRWRRPLCVQLCVDDQNKRATSLACLTNFLFSYCGVFIICFYVFLRCLSTFSMPWYKKSKTTRNSVEGGPDRSDSGPKRLSFRKRFREDL